MKNRRNYYRILSVQPDAPAAVIQASYRALLRALKMHPDLGGDHGQAVCINEAFATLGDPGRRAEYDRTLHPLARQRRAAAAVPNPSAAPPSPPRAADPAADAAAPATPAPPVAVCSFCQESCASATAELPGAVCPCCGSPLCQATPQRDGGRSRRAIGRVPRKLALTFRLATSRQRVWPGLTEDLSLNGMGLLAALELPVGARLQIECEFCSAVGVVRSARAVAGNVSAGWHYGVEFLCLHVKQVRGGLVATVA
jgi:curved DNA-binding protein CbpA